MPTYTGGLGVLAGDTIRSSADLAVPMVAVSLLHRRGYFFQRLPAEKHSALVRGAKLLLEKEVMSGADLKDIMAVH
jgi:glucan phosphorylase